MIKSLIADLGPWSWWILALILMGLEILAPGTFFLWFGISAFIIGTISLAMGPESTFWVWQTQVIGFLVLSLVAALFARRYMSKAKPEDETDLRLNQRGAQLIGRTAVVNQAILQGQGRVRIGESTWRVTGPDLPEGSMVRIIAADGGTLIVEPAERTAG
jgi:inner membrane protein